MKTNDPKTLLKNLMLKNREQRQHAAEQASRWINERKKLDEEFAALNQSYRIVGGEPFVDVSEQKPIADMTEEILRKYGKLHVDDVVAKLAEPPYERMVDKQSVVGTLVRYISQKKRFKRVGKNIFDVLEDK